MTRRQFNQLINELDGKSPFIVLHRDAVAPKYVGVEVSKDGMVYRYAIIGINDEYKAKKALISKILGIASYLNGNKPLKKGLIRCIYGLRHHIRYNAINDVV